MAGLEDMQAGMRFHGLAPAGLARVVHVEWYGDQAAKVTYEDQSGRVANRLVYRDEAAGLEIADQAHPWSVLAVSSGRSRS